MMKNSLLKILVTLGLVIGVSACQKKSDAPSGDESKPAESETESEPASEEPSESQPGESESDPGPQGPVALPNLASALELDYDQMDEETGDVPFVYEGQLISIPQLCVVGNYGNTFVVNQNHNQPQAYSDFSGITVELGENETSNAYVYDVVNVEGVLTNVRGHAELKDGKITEIVRPAWEINEDGTRGARLKDETGKNIGSVYYMKADSRAKFGNVGSPNNSGTLADLYVQFASIPAEEITADKEQNFYVVYPGENLDVDDDDNYSLIEVRIPEGLSERAIKRLNDEFFPTEEGTTGYQVGDYSVITGLLEFHDWAQGLVLDNYWGDCAEMAASEIPEVYNTFAELYAEYGAAGEIFNEGMFNFGDGLEEASAFSYVPGKQGRFMELWGDIIEQYPETIDPASESREFFLDDLNNTYYFSYVINNKNQEALVDALDLALTSGGLKAEVGFKLQAGVMYIYLLRVGEGTEAKVTRQINLNIYEDGSVEVEEMAQRVMYEGSVVGALTTMAQTNNATYVDTDGQSYNYTTKWDGNYSQQTWMEVGDEGIESGESYYAVINGKYEKDGIYTFEVAEGAIANPEFIGAAASITALPGSPARIASYFGGVGAINADDDQAVVTLENATQKLCYASAEELAADYPGMTVEQAAEQLEAINKQILNGFARQFGTVIGYSSLVTAETFVRATFTLVANNTYELRVYFTYSGQTVYAGVVVIDIGTTDLSDVALLVEALPAYVPAEGGDN